MKGGARRKTISSEPQLPPPPLPPQNQIDLPAIDEPEYNNPPQRPLIDTCDGDGDEYEEEEEEEDSEAGDDQFGSGNGLEGGGDGGEGVGEGEDGRPKLAEGFYEIEAVRNRRTRKGEVQYLIKWRGWPETANTWEPVENLVSISDVIDAFEERRRSGKQRSNRKRKRKQTVTPQSQSKKKNKQPQQERSPAATYDVPSVKVKIIEGSSSRPSVNNFSFIAENNVGGASNIETAKQLKDNRSLMVSPQIGERVEKNELDVKLSELKGTSSANQENMDEFAIHIQENRTAEGVSPANGVSKVVGMESVRASRRIGSNKRKSGNVKRFKKDSDSTLTNGTQDDNEKTTSASDVVGQHDIQNTDPMGNGLDSDKMIDIPRSMHAITKIIKPIDYSSSLFNNTQDISVTFLAMRSDGKEVIVDNKYLKANNPLLLIDFYEQHLRYSSPSE